MPLKVLELSNNKLSRRQFVQALGLGMAAGLGSSTYCGECANWLQLERKEVRLPNWDADGFRVALLADFHMNTHSEAERSQRAVSIALSEKPDLIAIGGDFINRTDPPMLANVKRVLEPVGDYGRPAVAVLGNHDYDCANPWLLIDQVESSGVHMLRNKIFESQGISVVGFDDGCAGRARFDFFPQGSVSRNCLALLHEPDFVDRMPSHISLQLSGHTHGGQVCLPFGVPLHTPRWGRKYIAGFYSDAKVPLYVTRGVGTVGPDYRLFCRPEVTILTLRAA